MAETAFCLQLIGMYQSLLLLLYTTYFSPPVYYHYFSFAIDIENRYNEHLLHVICKKKSLIYYSISMICVLFHIYIAKWQESGSCI